MKKLLSLAAGLLACANLLQAQCPTPDVTPPVLSNCPVNVTVNAQPGLCKTRVTAFGAPAGSAYQDASFEAISASGADGDTWQAFQAGSTGKLVQVWTNSNAGGVQSCELLVYEGAGTGGALLYRGSYRTDGGFMQPGELIPFFQAPLLEAGHVYTLRWTNYRHLVGFGNYLYPSSLDGQVTDFHDFNFRTYLQPVTTATATDNCSTATLQYSIPANDSFAVGVTPVTLTATDAAGNTATCSFTVTVIDNQAPSIDCGPAVQQVVTAGTCSASLTLQPPAVSDNCGIAGLVNNFNNSGNASGVYPFGTNNVQWTVTDVNGNTSGCTQQVIVTQPLVLTCAGDTTLPATPGICGRTVALTPPTVSSSCGNLQLTNDFTNSASGTALYPLGTTRVTWKLTDPATGAFATCVQQVTITDVHTLHLTCAGPVQRYNDPGICGAQVQVAVPHFDAGAGNSNCLTLTNSFTNTTDASGLYPKGVTVVTWTLRHPMGDMQTCQQTVTVLDGEAPVFSNTDRVITIADTACSATFDQRNGALVADASLEGLNATGFPTLDTWQSFRANNSGKLLEVWANSNSGGTQVAELRVYEGIGTDGAEVYRGPFITNGGFFQKQELPFYDAPTLIAGHMYTLRWINYRHLSGAIGYPYPSSQSGSTSIVRYVYFKTYVWRQPLNVAASAEAAAALVDAGAHVKDNCSIATFSSSHKAGVTLPLGTTVVTETATDDAGNSSTHQFRVTVLHAAQSGLNVSAAAGSVCAGATTTLTLNGYTGAAAPSWWTGPGATGSNLGSGTTLSNVGAGTYYAHLADAPCGGFDVVGVVTLLPDDTLAAQATVAAITNPICFNTTTTLVVNYPGTGTVSWYSGPNGTGTLLGAGLTLNGVGTGTYYARIVEVCGAATDHAITVTQTTGPATMTRPDDIVRCNELTGDSVVFSASPGTTFYWTNDNPSIGLAASGSGNLPSFAAINTGASDAVAHITVYPIITNCAGTPQAFTITVHPGANALSYPASICQAGLVAPQMGALTGGVFSASSGLVINPATGVIDAGATAPGTYNILYTAAAGNTGCTQRSTVVVNAAPALTLTADTLLCAGQSVTLAASGAAQYSWSPVSLPADASPVQLRLAIGLRKMSSSYTGPLIRLRRAADGAEMDFGTAGNDLDTAAVKTWLGTAGGYCVKLYDQSGRGGDAVQADAARQPLLVLNGTPTGRPVLRFTTTQLMVVPADFPKPFTLTALARISGNSKKRIISSAYNNWLLGWHNGNSQKAYFMGWVNEATTPANNSFTIYTGSSTGSTGSLYENGQLLAANGNGTEGPNGLQLNGYNGTNELSDCEIAEVVIYNTALPNNTRVREESDIRRYYIDGSSLTVPAPPQPVTYTVTATTAGCPAVTGTVTVASVPVDTAAIAVAAVNPVCPGATTTISLQSFSGSSNVTWYSGPNATGTNLGLGSTLANAGAGTYYAHISNRCGDVFDRAVTIATLVFNAATAPEYISAASNALCSGATTTLTVQAHSGGGAINWYTAANGGGTLLGTGAVLANVGPGTYYARIESSCGVPFDRSTTVTLIQVDAAAASAYATAAQTAVCANSSTTLSVAGYSGSSPISWYTGAGGTGTLLGTGATLANAGAGTYYARINAGCNVFYESSVTVALQVGAGTVSPIADVTYCNGMSVPASAFSSPQSGTTFTWTNSNPSIGLAASGSGSLPAFTPANNSAGDATATITVYPYLAGCVGTPVTFTITVRAGVPATVDYGAAAFCNSGSLAPVLTGSSAGTFTSATGLALNGSTGVIDLGASTAGTYIVSFMPAGTSASCLARDTLTVNAPPVITITGDSLLCSATSVLTASGAASFCWTPETLPVDAAPGSARLAVGTRLLNSSYTGPIIRLRRSSDDAELDFAATGGDLNVPAITAWLGGATGYAVKLYDQSGQGNPVVQATASKQPQLVLQGTASGRPVLRFGTAQYMTVGTNFPAPFTLSYTARQTGGARGRMLGSVNNNWLLGWHGGKRQRAFFNGWVSESNTNADNSTYTYTATSTGSIATLFENGQLIASNGNGTAGPDGIELNGYINGSETSDAEFMDVVLFNTVLGASARIAVENNMQHYYVSDRQMVVVAPASGQTVYTVTGTNAGCPAVSKSIAVRSNITGDPSVPGSGVWNVYAFNSTDWTSNYSGYYVATGVDFNTQTQWNTNSAPFSAPGYLGCATALDNFTWSAKRKGFPCAQYRISVPGHDDALEIRINGVTVLSHLACCDAHSNVWTGVLSDNDVVEIRGRDDAGGAYAEVVFATPGAGTISYTGSPFCAGPGTSAATLTGLPGGTWSASPAGLSINAATGAIDRGASQPGNYTVTYTLVNNGCGSTNTATTAFRISAPLGDPTAYGQNVWNMYVWNAGNMAQPAQSWNTAYVGYLPIDALSFNTPQVYASNNPSTSGAYIGCPAQTANHSWSARRQGFPCGRYTLRATTHRGSFDILINDVLIYSNTTASAVNSDILWTGNLGASDRIDIRLRGQTNVGSALNFQLTPITDAGFSYNTGSTCTGGALLTPTVTGMQGTFSATPAGLSLNPATGVINPLISQPGNYTVTNTAVLCNTTYTSQQNIEVTAAPGDPSVFPVNYWNVYVFNAGTTSGQQWTAGYAGFYRAAELNVTSWDYWNFNPSESGTYVGCPVGNDEHSWSARRQGFPCGFYRLNIPAHDDDVELWVNGVRVFRHVGCCDDHYAVWEGPLGPNDKIEFRVAQGNGDSYGQLEFESIGASASIAYTGSPFCRSNTVVPVTQSGMPGGTYSAASGLSINAATGAINLGTSTPGTYTVTYTLGAGCPDAFATTTSVTVQASGIPVNSQVLCAGSATDSVFLTGTDGSPLPWTNNKPGIGLAASGTGTIAPFVALNSGSTPLVATITVGGGACANVFTLTVNPTPATTGVPNTVYCAGSLAAAQPFGGTATSYSWTNSNPAIGLAASGTGAALPAFTATNGGTGDLQALVAVTPYYTNGGRTCTGKRAVSYLTVKPLPTVTTPASQVLCAGQLSAPVVFSGSLSATTYSWTASGTGIGLSASGTGNIAAFTAQNNTGAPIVATVTVTPLAGACTGAAATFTYTVSSSAGAISYAGSPYCNTGWAYVRRAGSEAGIYTAVPAGLVLNASTGAVNLALSQPGTYTVSYSVAAGSCPGTATAQLVISAPAVANPVPNQVFCSGVATAPIPFPGTATQYAWTNDNPSIGLPASGTGTSLPSFLPVNAGPGEQYATIHVTPLATATASCPGKAIAFRIRVNWCPTANVTGGSSTDASTLLARLEARFVVGPNPTQGALQLQYNGKEEGPFLVQLLSQYGTPVGKPFTFTGGSALMDITGITPGAYQLQVTHLKSGTRFNRQVIKL